jgi:hypothetical protein
MNYYENCTNGFGAGLLLRFDRLPHSRVRGHCRIPGAAFHRDPEHRNSHTPFYSDFIVFDNVFFESDSDIIFLVWIAHVLNKKMKVSRLKRSVR